MVFRQTVFAGGGEKPCGINVRGDTHNNALWAPTLGKYVAFTRTYGGRRRRTRQVARTESTDFVKWTPQKVVMMEAPNQTYSMPVFYLPKPLTPGQPTHVRAESHFLSVRRAKANRVLALRFATFPRRLTEMLAYTYNGCTVWASCQALTHKSEEYGRE